MYEDYNIDKEDPIQKGWYELLELAFDIEKNVPFSKIVSFDRRLGMLQVNFQPVDNLEQQFILDAITHKLERKSAVTCEHCGISNWRVAFRRKDLINPRVLCLNCYAFRLSDEYDKHHKKETPNVLDKQRSRFSFD